MLPISPKYPGALSRPADGRGLWRIGASRNGRLGDESEPVVHRVAVRNVGGFTLAETLIAIVILSIGLLGAFVTVLQGGKLVSAGEEDAFVSSGLEQRIDRLRTLDWTELTSGTGITAKVWTARPLSTTGLTVTQETITISPHALPTARTLNAVWNGVSSPSVSFTAGTALSGADAVKVVATLTWTGRRSGNQQTRGVVTVISRGGISKSDLP